MRIDLHKLSSNLKGRHYGNPPSIGEFRALEAAYMYSYSNSVNWDSFSLEDVESVMDYILWYETVESIDNASSFGDNCPSNEGNVLHEYLHATHLISNISNLKPTNPERVVFF